MRQASKNHERPGVGKLRVSSFQKLPSWTHGARWARANSRFCPKYPENQLILTLPTAKLRPAPQPAPGVQMRRQARHLKPLSMPFRASASVVPPPLWRKCTEKPKNWKNLDFSKFANSPKTENSEKNCETPCFCARGVRAKVFIWQISKSWHSNLSNVVSHACFDRLAHFLRHFKTHSS